MGLAGAASGAAQSLQEMLVQAFQQKQQEAALKLQQENAARQAAQFDATMADRTADRAFDRERFSADQQERQRVALRQAAQDATAQSDRTNAQGTRTMLGDFLTRRQPGKPLEDAERATLETMAVTDDIKLPSSLMEKPQRKVITTLGPRGGPVSRAVTEEELIAGVPEYREPKAASASAQQQDWVLRNGQPTPIARGTAQAGDVPYDPVAARQQNGATDPNTEALDTAREVARIADQLRKHPGMGGAFGVVDSWLPTMRQGTADAEALRESLMSLLTLENMGKMKGVLSDRDMQVLRQASTTLSPKMSNAAAKAELDRLVESMGRVTAGGGAGGVTVKMRAPDGSISDVPANQVEHYRKLGAQLVQ